MTKSLAIRLCAAALAVLLGAAALCACGLIAPGPDIVLTGSGDPEPTSPEPTETAEGTSDTEPVQTTVPESTAEETTEELTSPPETTEEITTEETTTAPPPETQAPWNLVLVNPWNPLTEEYEFDLTAVRGDSYFVDSRCADALKQMMADCKAAGFTPYICSAFREWEDQVRLFEKKVTSYVGKGYTDAEARALAAKEIAIPGTSEHQLGLAVDILCTSRPWLDEGQANVPTQKWLMANCHKYGFILRYPKGTTDITGIIYEPWHYRYVGVEIATEIMTRGITLEEYLGMVAGPEDTKVPPPEAPETTA